MARRFCYRELSSSALLEARTILVELKEAVVRLTRWLITNGAVPLSSGSCIKRYLQWVVTGCSKGYGRVDAVSPFHIELITPRDLYLLSSARRLRLPGGALMLKAE